MLLKNKINFFIISLLILLFALVGVICSKISPKKASADEYYKLEHLDEDSTLSGGDTICFDLTNISSYGDYITIHFERDSYQYISLELLDYNPTYAYNGESNGKFVNSLPRDERVKAFKNLKDHWKLHCEYLTLNPNRDIQVMFFTGKSGAGKTFYAKKFLDNLDYDYAISSSSNDPLQDYQGQDALILDDLRDSVFKFQDLLKMLDNNTASSTHSRFVNKVFNGKMIVITSSIPLRYWYKKNRLEDTFDINKQEDFAQLCRRISCYIEVSDDYVKVFNELDKNGNPIGDFVVYENEVKQLKKQKNKNTFDFKSAFDSFCSPVVEPQQGKLSLITEDLNTIPF